MFKKIKINIKNAVSPDDKALIETEIDVLKGVKDINVNGESGEVQIDFDDSLVSEDIILEAMEKFGYNVDYNSGAASVPREHIYFVKGMHCASCEILIENKLLSISGVKSVEAKAGSGEVLVEYIGKRPKASMLNSIFRKENYVFFDDSREQKKSYGGNSFFKTAVISFLIIAGFLFLNKLGLANLVNVNSKSSLFLFGAMGLVAGFSSCAALVGGMVLSMSKQWLDIYSKKESSMAEKFQPHLMFNMGRLISYAFFGMILGFLGSKLQISFRFTPFLVIAVSVLMVFLALQMLGVRAFRKFQFTLPKFVTRYIANESNFKGRYLPFSMGALTFFLPCGFTITAQGLALLSGNPLQGGLIMAFFALGTVPALLLIGFSAIKFSSRPSLSLQFSKVAGVLILFFALFNTNNQLTVLGLPSFGGVSAKSIPASNNGNNSQNENGLAAIVNGEQLIKMQASSRGYSPNYFKVKAGIPVRWEIQDIGTSGCTNAVISRSLFDGQISLTPGEVSIKEFTPQNPGKYKFSCWMGMISGVIEVVSSNPSSVNSSNSANLAANNNNDTIIPSGAKGCGCGGGGSSSCSAPAPQNTSNNILNN